MSLSDPTFLLFRAMSRSEQATLAIQADERKFGFRSPEFKVHFEIVQAEQHRWYSANLTIHPLSWSHIPRQLFTGAAPLLERLIVRSDDNGSSIVFEPLPTDAPMLEQVTLEHVPVAWGSAVLADLRSLCIRDALNEPTLTEIAEVLARNTTIEDLELQFNLSWRPTMPPSSTTSGRIGLPRLRRLKLADVRPALAEALLSGIQAPSCKYFFLSLYAAPSATQSALRGALEQALRFMPEEESSGGPKMQLKFTIRERTRRLVLQGPEKRSPFELQWHEDDANVGREWIKSHLLPRLRHTEVSVWFEPQDSGDDEGLQAFLRDIASHVSTLDFHSWGNNKWLLRTLDVPLDDGTFHFPVLTSLNIGMQCELEKMHRVIEGRYGRLSAGEGPAPKLPAPFKRLDVGPKGQMTRDEYKDVRAQIEAVVGGGVLAPRR